MSNFDIEKAKLKARRRPPEAEAAAAADRAAERMGWAETVDKPKGRVGRPPSKPPRPNGEVRPSFGLDKALYDDFRRMLIDLGLTTQEYLEQHIEAEVAKWRASK